MSDLDEYKKMIEEGEEGAVVPNPLEARVVALEKQVSLLTEWMTPLILAPGNLEVL